MASAYVQIGEYFFDRNKAYDALQAYAQAAKFKDSPNYGFAVYKLSWCYYNVGEYDQAIEGMKTVVRYSQVQQQTAGDTSSLMLQDEALKDLVRFFADAGDMQEAETYFRSLGKEDLYNKMLKRLAKMYFEQGKFSQSITTYRKLIAENADSPYAPNYQNEIINAYQRMNERANRMRFKNCQNYGKNSTWAAKNLRTLMLFVKRKTLWRCTVAYSSLQQRSEKLGAGKQAQSTYLLAKKLSSYLQEFPNGKNSYDMEYAFAELIYNLAEKVVLMQKQRKYFTEAYASYMKVVATDAKGKYSEFCAEAAIFAADELIGYDKKKGLVKSRKKDTDIDPIEMSPWESKKLEALDQYAKLYPNNKNTINHLYTSARLLFDKNLLDEASSRFRTVISMNPKSKQAISPPILFLVHWISSPKQKKKKVTLPVRQKTLQP